MTEMMHSSEKLYTTILDLLLVNKKAQPFIKALAKYNLLSTLGTKYNKKMKDGSYNQMPYTVFVPKKLKLPKSDEEAIQFLKCHIFKNRYDEESIDKMCNKYNEDEIVLSSLGGYKLTVKCSSKKKTIEINKQNVHLKKHVDCYNGIFFMIDDVLQVPEEFLSKPLKKEQKPSILELLFKNKTGLPFVMACAKHSLTSMLCGKFFDKRSNSRTAYTVLIPPKLKLPKDDIKAKHYLKSHFGKRNFDMKSITKFCKKQEEQGIVELKLGTMTNVTFQIKCDSQKLYDGKHDFELTETNQEKAINGTIYYLKKNVLHIPEM